MEASAPPLLHQVRFSHFNEKGRWSLDYKRLPHRRRSYQPGLHAISSRRLGGGGKMPILEFEDRTVPDSAAIVAELERIAPDPPLYPADERERADALELERWFGKNLGPGIRSALFHELLPDARATRELTMQGFGRPARAANAALYPVSRIAIRRALDADAEGAERGRRQTVEAMDRVEAELGGSDYLVGELFSVADLSGAALLAPVVAPPGFGYGLPARWPQGWEEFRDELRGRQAWLWVEEMYRRHRGASCEIL